MPETYGVPLFDIPTVEAKPATTAKTPIGITPSYAAALERSGGQCEQKRMRKGGIEPERCMHVVRYHRLYLCPDDVLRCLDYWKWAEAQAKPKPVRRARKK